MENRKCQQCGKDFQISDSEIEFFQRKNLHLPKRCKECRELNGSKNKQDHNHISHNSLNQNQRMRKTGNSTNYPGVPRKVNSNKSQKNSLIMAGIMLVVVFLIVGIFYISSKIDEINPLVSNEQTIQEEAPNVTQSVVEDVQTVEDIASHENTLQESSITESPSEIPSETLTDNTTAELISETTTSTSSSTQPSSETSISDQAVSDNLYSFQSEERLEEHFIKHGSEFGYATSEQYLSGANAVILSPEAKTKTEAEDGDYVYYLESTNEFVILGVEGYIKTYFKPDDGIDYYNRQ